MRHIFPHNLRRLKAFTFFSLLILVTIVATSSIASGQTLKARSKAAHVKFVPETAPPEDVYFNAQAREVPAPSLLSAGQVSATSSGNALSLLFDSARVSLQSEGDPMVATWIGTITVPIDKDARRKPKSYVQEIRGSVTKTPDTRVSILLELGGKSFVAEFPYGMKRNGDILRRFLSSIKPAASERYTASIVIFAERRNSKSAVLVDIDSLDVNAR